MAKRSSDVAHAVLVSVAALLLCGSVPGRVNYQGRLTDTNKNPRNGTFTMRFSIWDDGPSTGVGNELWNGTQSVPVGNGVFSVQLGASTPLPSTVFSSSTTYLQVEVNGEMPSARQRLVTSPYAFRAALADDLSPGDADYIQNTQSEEVGSAFFVSSGTVNGPMTVTGSLSADGIVYAGSAATPVTTADGHVRADALSGSIAATSLTGAYPTLTAGHLSPGDTNYLQNTNTLQSGSTFYVNQGTVAGAFTANGAVSLGSAGTADVTVQNNLTVRGSGPQIFGGNVQVNGNGLNDSGGTTRLTLGSNIVVNGAIGVPAGQNEVQISTAVRLTGAPNGDNYIAFPFVAGGTINNRDAVIISGSGTVGTTATSASPAALGIAVNGASAGQTVWVAMSGIITGVTSNGAITVGNAVCTSTTAGAIDDSCNSNDAPIGKALTGATASGQPVTVALFQGR